MIHLESTIDRLDLLNDTKIAQLHCLANDGLKVELLLSSDQRDIMINRYEAWTYQISDDSLSSVNWNATKRSNFELYCELRLNHIPFKRMAKPRIAVSIHDLDKKSDEEIMHSVNNSNYILEITDAERHNMIQSHNTWAQTLEEELKEIMEETPSDEMTNLDLYREIRINGITNIANQAHTMGM